MQFGISTQICRGRPVTVDLLESIRRAGYDRFELFCNRPHLDFHDRSLLRSIGRWFKENALPAPSLHLPFVENVGPVQRIWISVLAPERRHREAALDEIKRSLELAEYLDLAYVVMHLGNPQDTFHPVMFEFAYAAISQIRAFGGADVMVENIANEFSSMERIEEFRNVAQMPHIGICYDTGHGHLQGGAGDLSNVRATHVHDNNGQKDEHLWPFAGTLNWPALVEKLVNAGYPGPLIFEARGEEPAQGADARSRLLDLWEEARYSIEEYRLKYGIDPPVTPEEP